MPCDVRILDSRPTPISRRCSERSISTDETGPARSCRSPRHTKSESEATRPPPIPIHNCHRPSNFGSDGSCPIDRLPHGIEWERRHVDCSYWGGPAVSHPQIGGRPERYERHDVPQGHSKAGVAPRPPPAHHPCPRALCGSLAGRLEGSWTPGPGSQGEPEP